LKVKLDPGAYMPERAHPEDAGLDLRTPTPIHIPRGGYEVIKTGVHIALPRGTGGILKSKSGLSVRYCIHTVDGVIDEGYTGEISVKLHNAGTGSYHLRRGDKITQLIIVPIIRPEIELVDELDETDRGSSGFGSTGR
jgi:dUTP pyrophosphatase